jgi:hypothetical protein
MNGTIILGMISLFIIMIISTPSYIDSASVQAWKQAEDISSTLSALSTSKDNYERLHGESVTSANWRTEIESLGRPVPTYGSAQWFYNSNAQGNYFCLRVNGSMINSRWYLTLNKAKKKSGLFSYVNQDCGATSDFGATPDFSAIPSISITAYTGD